MALVGVRSRWLYSAARARRPHDAISIPAVAQLFHVSETSRQAAEYEPKAQNKTKSERGTPTISECFDNEAVIYRISSSRPEIHILYNGGREILGKDFIVANAVTEA